MMMNCSCFAAEVTVHGGHNEESEDACEYQSAHYHYAQRSTASGRVAKAQRNGQRTEDHRERGH